MKRKPPVIFVVDDDAFTLHAISRTLRSAGYEVAPFSSPEAFLDALSDDDGGCVILDMMMPRMSGLDVQRALRERRCSLPIVFVTGHADVPTSVRAMKDGALDLLVKPFEVGDLLAAAARALARDKAARAARAEFVELRAAFESLSPREREVARMVSAGMLNKQIAAELGTSEKTVAFQRGCVMEKLDVRSLADLVRLVDRIDASEAP